MPEKPTLSFGPKAASFLKRTTSQFEIRRGLSRRQLITYMVSGFIVLVIFFYGFRVLFLKDFAAQSKAQIYTQLEEARSALHNLDPAGARDPLAAIDNEVRLIQSEADRYGVLSLSRIWNIVSDKFQAVPSMLQNLAGISGTAIHLNEDIEFLRENAAQLMIEKHGPELINRLTEFRAKLGRLTDFIDRLGGVQSGLDEGTMLAIANLRAEIDRSSQALDALIPLLSSATPRHLLVLFENPTEIRGGGGFIGSYAHIEIQSGGINNIEIRDIYDPDGQLDQRVIPPEPLQMITKDWEARDANWFFDYPTSARKVITFLNNSKIYQERGVRFDGAIAINTNVLKDLVTLIGPTEIPEYRLTLTSENFLAELQREVESGADKKVNQPKRILKVFAPLILKQLTTLDGPEKQLFASLLARHLTQKDIMLYFVDPDLQRYVRSRGVAGDILQANPAAVSEYLAVVNSNIGGAKSDAFVSQKIDFDTIINESGELLNTVTVTRKHAGNTQKDWWYRATNRNYMQIYTALGSRLTGAAGRSLWPRTPSYNYKDYAVDSDLAAIESTRRYLDDYGVDRSIINEKTVFAAWVNTLAGATSKYILTYKNPRAMNLSSSIPYEFVFEKQSGASTALSISITAPPRYKWKEVNQGVIEYQTDDPPGRIRIRQTLIPIE